MEKLIPILFIFGGRCQRFIVNGERLSEVAEAQELTISFQINSFLIG